MAEKRETIRLSPDDLGEPIEVELNTTYRLVLQEDEPPVANLNLAVFNFVDKMPLEDVEYELEGCGEKFTGRTRKGGAIVRTQVPAGAYELSIGGRKYTVATDPKRDRSQLVHVVVEPQGSQRGSDVDALDTEGLSEEEMSDVFALADQGEDEPEGSEPEQDDG